MEYIYKGKKIKFTRRMKMEVFVLQKLLHSEHVQFELEPVYEAPVWKLAQELSREILDNLSSLGLEKTKRKRKPKS